MLATFLIFSLLGFIVAYDWMRDNAYARWMRDEKAVPRRERYYVGMASLWAVPSGLLGLVIMYVVGPPLAFWIGYAATLGLYLIGLLILLAVVIANFYVLYVVVWLAANGIFMMWERLTRGK